MKPLLTLLLLALLTGCAHAPNKDFVQGWTRITPPIQMDTSVAAGFEDGGTQWRRFTDAKGRVFDVYIDYRIGTKTRGAIYLKAYPGEWRSVRVKQDAEFRQKLGFQE